ncbi:MAG TPA: glycosyltransferase, partial [Anaerolineales bacterium]|nr:glycosyltransferase [Anaerolineales bacterium]
VKEKGIFDLVEALTLLRPQADFRLAVAGVGADEGKLQTEIRRAGLNGNVTLMGYLQGQDLERAYQDADLFVFPSWREGLPLVLLEAMDYGLPIVATQIRGAADYLCQGQNVLFVPAKAPAARAAAILGLVKDLPLRCHMSAANREKIKEFAPDMVGRQYLAVLQQVVGAQVS